MRSSFYIFVWLLETVSSLGEWTIGFGLCGTPDTLIEALSRRKDVGKLTAVSNNVGSGEKGLGKCTLFATSSRIVGSYTYFHSGKLLHSGHLDKMMASYIGGYVHPTSI